MKERPILFSAPMVRALLAGTKTQTRRICKPAMAHSLSHVVEVPDPQERGQVYNGTTFGDEEGGIQFTSPYGGVRDRLWVRETWNWFDPGTIPTDRAGARAPFTGSQAGRDIPWVAAYAADGHLPYPGYEGRDHWRPSIHMPRWASRITLDITGVRVERLQDIHPVDALKEGLEQCEDLPYLWDHPVCLQTAVKLYSELWEQINGAGSWAKNPWVWVVEFKRVQQASSGRPSQLEDAPCNE
ncbi:hypothetical protein [Delftia tsuruhatensis]|uniref:hypothetical protein n=1 Tax=Delftia tsuruhatensis TaxID=180282 RepID=UPI002027E717|nr:hypothetical protein [Delftia tsuruhatensis]